MAEVSPAEAVTAPLNKSCVEAVTFSNFQRASGVRNERPDRLLDPARVASWIFDDVARGRRGIRDYGATTHVFRVLRGVLPRGMYLPLIDRLMRKYR